ncbi:hypothetical protein AYO20_09304 [Fonsecaea nubica]|uniref:Uncharacterized protein n=1 Tax=Fonsecaea nubica TaxID=856822 RepID=A0A178CK91_9EURO|nr:hypothetical protein AYO20_09304 [Fonsecaea nubica]OAL29151.1 hypothetical protein AYO20_09304 [Fonsecaea nubica]
MASTTSTNTNTTGTASKTTTGTFTLLLFASASTFAGGVETLRLPAPTTLRGVFDALEAQFPGMRDAVLRSAAVTVNLEYIDVDPDIDANANAAATAAGQKRDGDVGGDATDKGDGLDMVINAGDEVGIIPPYVYSGPPNGLLRDAGRSQTSRPILVCSDYANTIWRIQELLKIVDTNAFGLRVRLSGPT